MQPTTALNWVLSHEWAISRDKLPAVLSMAESASDSKALAALAANHINEEEAKALHRAGGRTLRGTRNVWERDGVAVLSINGPITRHESIFSFFFGGTSIDALAKDFHTALTDPSVGAIVLDIDSPGGEITGINEFANMIYAARDKKEIWSYVGGFGASAGYWIASAASKIYADATANIGSIGVVMAMARGNGEYEVVSSQSPYKRPTNEDEYRQRLQERVDAMADVFIRAVARNRGVTTKKVLSDYGKGDTLIGVDAVNAGLVDGISSLEQVVNTLATKLHAPRQSRRIAATATFTKPPHLQSLAARSLDVRGASCFNIRNSQGGSKMSLLDTLLGRRATDEETQQAVAELVGVQPQGYGSQVPGVIPGTINPIGAGIVIPQTTPAPTLQAGYNGHAQVAPVHPVTTAIPAAAGAAPMNENERAELERLRAERAANAQAAQTQAHTQALTIGAQLARAAVAGAKIEPRNETAFAAAFAALARLANNPALNPEDKAVTWAVEGAVDTQGQQVLASCSVLDFFAAAVQGSVGHSWSKETAPQPAVTGNTLQPGQPLAQPVAQVQNGAALLLNRTQTTPAPVPGVGNRLPDEAINRMVAAANGGPVRNGAAK